MPLRIEDYALIGDTETAALVGNDGSIDWLCLPRFDSAACFAALLGDPGNGRWRIAPAGAERATRRSYRGATLVLETEWETPAGAVRVTDCMPLRGTAPDVLRVVEGVRGRVEMEMELVIRFDYGYSVPWVRAVDDLLVAVAGPERLVLRTPVETSGEDRRTVASFAVGPGDRVPFVLTWQPSVADEPPVPYDPDRAVTATERWWAEWAARSTHSGAWSEAVERSLITLKALTYAPTGGIVAAPTTSLPEWIGSVRNWDYRACWLRDATLTLLALLDGGYVEEAAAWRDWLLRAVAGAPDQFQILYGPAGERRLPELEIGWLAGYEGSKPVRVGNAAAGQLQLDVYGEVMDMLHQAREAGLDPDPEAWKTQVGLLDFLEGSWDQPDEGIWEVRSGRRHFTHSKVMSWVAFDRAVSAVERFGLDGPVERWRRLREEIHREVCERGYDRERRTFVRSYGSTELDASLLMVALTGFLPPGDERVRGTVAAVERELCRDGFVLRYRTDAPEAADGLPPGEGAFLPCTFWLASAQHAVGRTSDARTLFERLLALRNDVGLLAEEWDPVARRQLGNFPQAFTHVALIESAVALAGGAPTRTAAGAAA